jgi:hypothetical protein
MPPEIVLALSAHPDYSTKASSSHKDIRKRSFSLAWRLWHWKPEAPDVPGRDLSED